METIRHMCLSVRGALTNWSDRRFIGVFKHDDGRSMTPKEAKATLLEELSKGHEVIPCGPVCEGFDYSGGGCPGHPVHKSTTLGEIADELAKIDGYKA